MASSDASDVPPSIEPPADGTCGSEAVAAPSISAQRQANAAAAVGEFRALVDGDQPPADAGGHAAVGDKALLPEIDRLKNEQKRIRAERKAVTKELKNAEKRRSRLKKKAKQLSDGDLLQVLHMRSAEKILKTSASDPPTEGAASSSAGARQNE